MLGFLKSPTEVKKEHCRICLERLANNEHEICVDCLEDIEHDKTFNQL